jgi:hypothetical protein
MSDLEAIVLAIRQACEAEFATNDRVQYWPTHIKLNPADARALAQHMFASIELVDGLWTATAFADTGNGPVTIVADPKIPVGTAQAFTPGHVLFQRAVAFVDSALIVLTPEEAGSAGPGDEGEAARG